MSDKSLEDRLLGKIIKWRQDTSDLNTFERSLKDMISASLDMYDNPNINEKETREFIALAMNFALKQASYTDER